MGPTEVVNLAPVMLRSSGRPETAIGLIDGPVVITHPDFANSSIREVPGKMGAVCSQASSVACRHGTFVAGILAARRGSAAPAICPNCTLLARPIFAETNSSDGDMPSATPEELAEAIVDCVQAGARVLNLSAALAQPSSRGERKLEEALNDAARRGVIVVAAAGNQGTVGSSAITRHPAVIPVASCDLQGRPTAESNLGSSIGRLGLSAPGEGVTSLGTNGTPQTFGGTSAAAPFVTGAIALLWSEFPKASATQIKLAVTQSGRRPGTPSHSTALSSVARSGLWGAGRPRKTVVPPLLDAWAAYQSMQGA